MQFLKNEEIDKVRWDECLHLSPNALIYAHSFYLDNIATGWSALTGEDYEWILPVTHKNKYGISYLYQPPFTQQLGIFSSKKIDDEMQQMFVTEAKQHFRFAELFVNFSVGPAQANFILPLQQTYQLIRQQYKNDLLKNLKHAAKFNLRYVNSDDIQKAVHLYQLHYAERTPHVRPQDYEHFVALCQSAKQQGLLLIRQVLNQGGNTLAIALLLKDKQRLYNLMSTVTKEGRQCEANHFLFDELIQEFSGQDVVLDFEGSSIAGIADFYQKFGAVNEPYFLLRYNHLSWPVKYFK